MIPEIIITNRGEVKEQVSEIKIIVGNQVVGSIPASAVVGTIYHKVDSNFSFGETGIWDGTQWVIMQHVKYH